MKTGREIILNDEIVEEHRCDDCESICNDVGYYYWRSKDFTLCKNCFNELVVFDKSFNRNRDTSERQKLTIPEKLRWEIFNRDQFTCQYCGSTHVLAVDHVIPESRGGPTQWLNLVTACKTCNSKKRDRTPDEAGMKLLKEPSPLI